MSEAEGVRAAARRINFHRQGDGPPLLLLHGVGLTWRSWGPVIPRLAGEFEIWACDTPGFGGSPPLPADIEPTITTCADAFAAFLVERGLERPHVAGSSMGGAIALELARRGLVASATAVSPAGFWSALELRYLQASVLALDRMPRVLRPALVAISRTRLGRRLLARQYFGRPELVPAEEVVAILEGVWAAPSFAAAVRGFERYEYEQGGAGGGSATARSGQRGDGRGDGDAAITVAWGNRDRLLPYRLQAPRARRRLPDAHHVTLGGGHLPFFEDPAALAEAIRQTAGRAAVEPSRAAAPEPTRR